MSSETPPRTGYRRSESDPRLGGSTPDSSTPGSRVSGVKASTHDVVGSATEPALAVDHEGKIVAWNRPIEKRLGYRRSRVVGRRCWEVLAGEDAHGEPYCSEACPLLEMARQGQSLRHCDLFFRDAAGERSGFSVCTLTFAGRASHIALVHLLTEAPASESRVETRPLRRRERKLTAREIEVLELIAAKRSTREIAEQLSISVHTVRNHIQRALSKLGVHSRLEAVCRARRLGHIG